jgi:hypothetical protein
MSDVVVIQEVLLSWTKASRGGAGAARRNAVPLIAPLPPNISPAGDVLFHVVRLEEHQDFAAREQFQQRHTLPASRRCLSFQRVDDGIAVSYARNRECGAPGGDLRPPRHLFVVHPGELARAICNGRFVGEGAWWYEQMVANVAVLMRRDLPRFHELVPAAVADLRASLR